MPLLVTSTDQNQWQERFHRHRAPPTFQTNPKRVAASVPRSRP
jgi:hypothetical protein